jgi:transposase
MRRTTKYVALDVHQATTVSSVRDETGRVIARTVIPTEADALLAFVASMRGAVHVTFEEGTQAQWLSALLTPVVQRVVVCNRRGEAATGHKSDRHDADDLSERLRLGQLRAVYHGDDRTRLKELTRTYANVLQDAKRVMQRLKALFRARGIKTPGMSVYRPEHQDRWLAQLTESGARFRAETLYTQLRVLQELRPRVKRAMVQEAQRDPAWPVLRSIPYFGPVRIALLLATLQTPWRFRTKRHLWAYAGLAVVTRTSAEYEIANDRPVRRRKRWVQTRGLNRNHNPVVKDVFKSAATSAATRGGPLQDWYAGVCARGLNPDLARVTLARKLAALTLHLWKTGEPYDPTQLSVQAG